MSKRGRERYPDGFTPGVWKCPKCGVKWCDNQTERGMPVAWDKPAYCFACNRSMTRIADEVEAKRPHHTKDRKA